MSFSKTELLAALTALPASSIGGYITRDAPQPFIAGPHKKSSTGTAKARYGVNTCASPGCEQRISDNKTWCKRCLDRDIIETGARRKNMTYTYDLNEHGCLIITADDAFRQLLRERTKEKRFNPADLEADILCALTAGELERIRPEEIGALTDAPILGLRRGYMEIDAPENPDNEPAPNRTLEEANEVIAAWGFMDYAVRFIHEDLIEKGRCVFIS